MEKEKNFKIYIHNNTINQKKYIGQTKQSLSRRFRNGQGYKNCIRFYNAIQKYGWDNFQHYIVYDNLTQEEANILQRQLISKYNTINPDYGYNISQGGDSLIPSEKISKKNKERWEEGVYDSIKNKIYCVELDRFFESALEAKRQLNIDDSSIAKVCKGKLNYAGIIDGKPLHWLYEKDITEEKIQELKNRKEQIKGRSIKRKCIQTGIIYESAIEAAEKLNISASSIGKCCKNKNRTCGGYHWENVY